MGKVIETNAIGWYLKMEQDETKLSKSSSGIKILLTLVLTPSCEQSRGGSKTNDLHHESTLQVNSGRDFDDAEDAHGQKGKTAIFWFDLEWLEGFDFCCFLAPSFATALGIVINDSQL